MNQYVLFDWFRLKKATVDGLGWRFYIESYGDWEYIRNMCFLFSARERPQYHQLMIEKGNSVIRSFDVTKLDMQIQQLQYYSSQMALGVNFVCLGIIHKTRGLEKRPSDHSLLIW